MHITVLNLRKTDVHLSCCSWFETKVGRVLRMNKYKKTGFTVSGMKAVVWAAWAYFTSSCEEKSTKAKLIIASYQSYSNLRRRIVGLWRFFKWWPFSSTLLQWCALISRAWSPLWYHSTSLHTAPSSRSWVVLNFLTTPSNYITLSWCFIPCLWTCAATGQRGTHIEHIQCCVVWTKDGEYAVRIYFF